MTIFHKKYYFMDGACEKIITLQFEHSDNYSIYNLFAKGHGMLKTPVPKGIIEAEKNLP